MAWDDLKRYIGVKHSDHDEYIQDAYAEAEAYLNDALVNAFRPVPDAVYNSWLMKVGYTCYTFRKAPGNGQYQQYDGDVTPVRIPRDPLFEIKPMLARYVVMFR